MLMNSVTCPFQDGEFTDHRYIRGESLDKVNNVYEQCNVALKYGSLTYYRYITGESLESRFFYEQCNVPLEYGSHTCYRYIRGESKSLESRQCL